MLITLKFEVDLNIVSKNDYTANGLLRLDQKLVFCDLSKTAQKWMFTGGP